MTEAQAIPWYKGLQAAGLKPFIATSETLLGEFDLAPWGIPVQPVLLENDGDADFLRAYLFSEQLAYRDWSNNEDGTQTTLQSSTPDWVFVDCILLQTAAIGLMIPTDLVPDRFRRLYAEEAGIAVGRLSHLPLCGEVTAARDGGHSLAGVSSFNLYRTFFGMPRFTREYRAIALAVRRASDFPYVYAASQYVNPAIRVFSRFGTDPVIAKPMIPLYTDPYTSFLFKMKIEFDPCNLKMRPVQPPDRRVYARDTKAKRQIAEEIAAGWSHRIVPPYWMPGSDDRPNEPFLTIRVFPHRQSTV